jgi:Cu+-exporting ATPase
MASNDHHEHHSGGSCCSGHAAISATEGVIRDPVCGMTVDPAAGKPSTEHDGRQFHFCSESCRTKFVAHPDNYLAAKDPVCGMNVDRTSAKHF